VIGAPILGAIALLIRLDSPGPALFKQPRHGFNNRVFDVYKFRSMRNDKADLKAEQQTVAGDARVRDDRLGADQWLSRSPALWG